MDEEKFLVAIASIAAELRNEMARLAGRVDVIAADAAGTSNRSTGAGDMGHGRNDMRRKDNDKRRDPDEYPADPDGARLTAADSVPRSEFSALAAAVAGLQKTSQQRTMGSLQLFEEEQARCDAVLRQHNLRAEPPLPGEDITAYGIRCHRKLQPHSPRWGKVDLGLIARDLVALQNVFGEIRADALEASQDVSKLKPFEWKETVEGAPGGHQTRQWRGRGTIFAKMAAPHRLVQRIGVRPQ